MAGGSFSRESEEEEVEADATRPARIQGFPLGRFFLSPSYGQQRMRSGRSRRPKKRNLGLRNHKLSLFRPPIE